MMDLQRKTGSAGVTFKQATLWKPLLMEIRTKSTVFYLGWWIWPAENWICVKMARNWISTTSVWKSVQTDIIVRMDSAVMKSQTTCKEFWYTCINCMYGTSILSPAILYISLRNVNNINLPYVTPKNIMFGFQVEGIDGNYRHPNSR